MTIVRLLEVDEDELWLHFPYNEKCNQYMLMLLPPEAKRRPKYGWNREPNRWVFPTCVLEILEMAINQFFPDAKWIWFETESEFLAPV